MIKQAAVVSVFLSGWLFATACGGDQDDAVVRVTIDMRCGPQASCPAGFACATETEHGPPTTLCESRDPAATCPAGFETKAAYGQTFCVPHPGVGARQNRAEASNTRGRRATRASDGAGHSSAGF